MSAPERIPFRLGFDEPDLDPRVWFPYYLPHWSSRADSRASYRIADGRLVLELLPGEGAWCADDHRPPMRVSGIQTGSFAGPLGSTVGQQPFRDGQTVREEQPRFSGHLQDGGRVEIRCAMTISPRSMAALWMIGVEDEPQRSGELCVVEIFGRDVDAGGAAVGMGVHPFRDPRLVEDFARPHLAIDVAEPHDYGVEWGPEGAVFDVDGEIVRRVPVVPDYPLQLELAVFDCAEWGPGEDSLVPRLTVERISGWTVGDGARPEGFEPPTF